MRRPHTSATDGDHVTPALLDRRTEPVPLVIAQHGIDSFPERVFSVADDKNLYHDYGHALVRAGFAVLTTPRGLFSAR